MLMSEISTNRLSPKEKRVPSAPIHRGTVESSHKPLLSDKTCLLSICWQRGVFSANLRQLRATEMLESKQSSDFYMVWPIMRRNAMAGGVTSQ